MANLPMDRTKLNAAITNQQPSVVASSQANREALVETADTIDLLNQKVDSNIAAGVLSPYPPSFLSRQAIINGNFDVWQRGTSFSTKNSYGPDRWTINDDGGTPLYSVSQQAFTIGQTLVPGEPKYYAKISVSALSTGTISFGQKIEGVRSFAGQQVTLSFWAKADIATSGSQVQCVLFQLFGTGGTPSGIVNAGAVNIVLTTSWVRYTMTLTLPSITGKVIGTNNDNSLYVQVLRLDSTAPITNYYIAQVQLCAGDAALPFQPRTFAEELALCQRYYEKSFRYATAPANSIGTNQGAFVFPSTIAGTGQMVCGTVNFAVPKRSAPTIVSYNPSALNAQVRNVTQAQDCTATVADASESSFYLLTNGSALTAVGDTMVVHWSADAEL